MPCIERDGHATTTAIHQPDDGSDTVQRTDYSHSTQFAGESTGAKPYGSDDSNYSTTVCELLNSIESLTYGTK
jgi:hypothetical protein